MRATRGILTLGVADLLRTPGQRRDESLDAVLDDLHVLGSEVPAGSPVHLELHLESVNEAVVVRGTASAPWVGECRRCLGPVRGTLAAGILEIFEADPSEGETQPLHGESIDLEPVARETVLLDLPLAPLCREDCAGLCPTCGAERNEVACACSTEGTDPRWSALAGLDLAGLDPPGVDPPGVDPPGVDPPGVDPPGVDPPGVDPPGVDPPGVEGPDGREAGA